MRKAKTSVPKNGTPLVLKERGLGFKPTPPSFKTKKTENFSLSITTIINN